MDQNMRARLDTLIEREAVEGFRVLDLPFVVQKALDAARELNPAIPTLEKIRLTKLNPKKKALVHEAVLARFHTDLQGKVLSNKAIRQFSIDNGSWSPETDLRIEELQMDVNRLMTTVSMTGLDQEREWRETTLRLSAQYLEALDASDKHSDEKEFLKGVFIRWANYLPHMQDQYTTDYATVQNRAVYSADVDLERLFNTAPTEQAADALDEISEIQNKLYLYVEMFRKRQELMGLLVERATMYGQSLETRRETAEEIARIYYGATALSMDGVPIGPIAPTLDAFWEMPEELVGWLTEEAYFFYNMIPGAIRNNLDDWGFTMAGRETGLLRLFEESPAPQSSKIDISVLPETVPDSSELQVHTI